MSEELQLGATPSDLVDNLNALIYIINSEIKKINTADLVRVIAVNEDNTIDVQPLLGSIRADGSMNETSPIYGIRYFQWQFGLNKIKAVPAVGDVGLIVCCKRDISNVENGNVGSFRQFSLADGIYIGGIEGLNKQPEQIIEFNNQGISITTPNSLTINGTVGVNINSPMTTTSGALSVGNGASGVIYTGGQVLTFTNGILTSIG